MSPSVTPSTITIHHAVVGRMRLLASFPAHMHDFLTTMIADGDVRCILYEGDHFVALEDVEPYSVTSVDGEDVARPPIISADAVAELLQTIKEHAYAAVQAKRSALLDSVPRALSPGTSHPFARFDWAAFWRDVARVGASLASEGEAQRVNDAFAILATSAENGTLEGMGLPQFHRTLLSLAHPALEQQFDDIWSPGRGRLEMPKGPQAQTTALAILRRLTAMYSGYRGTPEGSETPQLAMDAYLQIVKLKPAL